MTRTLSLLVCILIVACNIEARAYDLSSVPECRRPETGTVRGACAVRNSPAMQEQSPYPLLRWATCLQTAFHLPSGGYGDAVFFSDLVPEFEKEIEANLKTLDQVLVEEDRKVLKREQLRWEAARKRAADKRAKELSRDGTMYSMFGASTALASPETRAIELACRIEKLEAK